MTFTLKIACDNAAFEADQLWEELARLLTVAASRVRDGHTDSALVDINGNQVGQFALRGGQR